MFQQLDRLTPRSARWLYNFPRNSSPSAGWMVCRRRSFGWSASQSAGMSVSLNFLTGREVAHLPYCYRSTCSNLTTLPFRKRLYKCFVWSFANSNLPEEVIVAMVISKWRRDSLTKKYFLFVCEKHAIKTLSLFFSTFNICLFQTFKV